LRVMWRSSACLQNWTSVRTDDLRAKIRTRRLLKTNWNVWPQFVSRRPGSMIMQCTFFSTYNRHIPISSPQHPILFNHRKVAYKLLGCPHIIFSSPDFRYLRFKRSLQQ
jgi:hypothetical protein